MHPYVPASFVPGSYYQPPRMRPQGGGLDPNAPEFIPQAAKLPSVSLALGVPPPDPRMTPQFVSHGGFKPTALMSPRGEQEKVETPAAPAAAVPEKKPSAPSAPKTWANIAKESKDLPAEKPAPEPLRPLKAAAKATAKAAVKPTSTKTSSKTTAPSSTSTVKSKSGRANNKGGDNDSQPSRPATAEGATKKPRRNESTGSLTAGSTSPSRASKKSTRRESGSSKSRNNAKVTEPTAELAAADQPTANAAEPRAQAQAQAPSAQVAEAVAATKNEVSTDAVRKDKDSASASKQAASSAAAVEPLKPTTSKWIDKVLAASAPKDQAMAAPEPPALKAEVSTVEEEKPVKVEAPQPSTLQQEKEDSETEHQLVDDAEDDVSPMAAKAVDSTGSAESTAPVEPAQAAESVTAESVAAESVTADSVAAESVVAATPLEPTTTMRGFGLTGGNRPSSLFDSARLKAFMPSMGLAKGGIHSANVMLEAMRSGSKLAGLDNEQRVTSTVVVERKAAPVSTEEPTPSVSLTATRSSRDRLMYAVESLIAVQSHPACNVLTEELRQSDMSSILKKDDMVRENVVESLYRNKGLSSRTTSNQFAMPAVLKQGGNLLEMNMHVWSNKTRSRGGAGSDSEWQRPAARAVPMPTNVEVPELPKNSWQVRQKEQKDGAEDTVRLMRRLRAQLNKMTPATYQAIFEAILAIGIDTEDQAEQFGQLIFDKAITNHQYIEMYATLCTDLRRELDRRSGTDFKGVLLNCCQKTFDSALKDEFVPPENADEEEMFEALLLHKRKMKGNLMFVGALAAANLISAKILTHCVRQLLHGKKALQLEALAAFIPTIRTQMLNSKEKTAFSHMYEEIKEMSENPELERRIQCLLKDAVEQRPPSSTISVGGRTLSARTITTDGFAPARTRSNR